jgi:hypothetical protein
MLNVPPAYVPFLTRELAGLDLQGSAGRPAQAVLLFVHSLAEATSLAPLAISAVQPDGLLWIAYPKGGSGIQTDLNRDRLWHALEPTGWRPVRQVALDEVWSAMRLRPAEKVGK